MPGGEDVENHLVSAGNASCRVVTSVVIRIDRRLVDTVSSPVSVPQLSVRRDRYRVTIRGG